MITFSKVTKQFSRVRAVNELSFTVNQGEIFALLGPNGAGKTTSLRMLLQLINPDEGAIRYSESLLTEGKLERTRIGYLPEERGIYQDTPILKTLVYLASLRGMPTSDARKSAMEWLERFEIADRAADKVSTLSKGNQQKIQFIASIMHGPEFAILDEPFSGFDPINQEVISDMIRGLREQGTTILLSAHQMLLVERIADRLLLLSDGRELMSGTMLELRRKMGDGQKLEVQFSALTSPSLLVESSLLDAREDTATGMWQVLPRPGVPLNDALQVLTQAGRIETLRTAQANLHDIFIQSFGTTNGGNHAS
ncbi:MAG: ATP-binding cassette domain-containing protein [Bacteroidetes bacterium]|nr:ATP-binding cassette domain-containing protein [Bacteroidota bacterium]MCH8524257.1 ATP-binding cassette domain-containing protein [Balneolales bacterium]